MIAVLIVAAAWLAVGGVVAVVLGRSIRIADEKEHPQRPVLTVVRDAA